MEIRSTQDFSTLANIPSSLPEREVVRPPRSIKKTILEIHVEFIREGCSDLRMRVANR